MEPLKGGLLASPPDSVREILTKAEPECSAASWGIRFAANLDGVLVVLSGMSSIEQMDDNLSYMKDFYGLSEMQEGVIVAAREALAKIPMVPCTTCNYCAKICPMEIGISGTFTAKNIYMLYGNLEKAKNEEGWLVRKHGRRHASECIWCGACEAACPQHIQIRQELADAARLFGQI